MWLYENIRVKSKFLLSMLEKGNIFTIYESVFKPAKLSLWDTVKKTSI